MRRIDFSVSGSSLPTSLGRSHPESVVFNSSFSSVVCRVGLGDTGPFLSPTYQNTWSRHGPFVHFVDLRVGDGRETRPGRRPLGRSLRTELGVRRPSERKNRVGYLCLIVLRRHLSRTLCGGSVRRTISTPSPPRSSPSSGLTGTETMWGGRPKRGGVVGRGGVCGNGSG